MKRIIMLACILTSLCFLSVGAENVTINGFTVELTNSTETNYTGRITGTDSLFSGVIYLNDSNFVYNKKPVHITAIADGAFHSGQSGTGNKLAGVTRLVINLTSLDTLGNYTFRDCTNLLKVTLNEGLKVIGKEAFRNCEVLTTINIPGSVDSIGNSVFYDCAGLESVTFEPVAAGVENTPIRIGFDEVVSEDNSQASMFKRNRALRTVNLARNFNCVGGTLIDSDIKYTPFGDCEQITTLNINEGCTVLGDYAFRDCEALTAVTISEGLQKISKQAFRNCKAITEITIPGSVDSIGNSVFHDCNALATVTFEKNENDTPLAIGYNKVGSGSMFKLNSALRTVNLARNFNCVGGTLKDSDIKYTPFGDCEQITTLNINEGCTVLGDYAFRDCEALTAVTISEGLQKISKQAFRNCNKLTEIIIPGSVDSIGNAVFLHCNALESVTFEPNESGTLLQVGFDDIEIINTDNNTTTKGIGSLFKHNSALKSAYIARNFKYARQPSSGDNKYTPFADCRSLSSVALMEGCDSVGSYMFYNNTALVEVEINDSATIIKEGAFQNCSTLRSITIPGCITTIENNVFKGCALDTVAFLKNQNNTLLTIGVTSDDNATAAMFVNNGLKTVHLARPIECSMSGETNFPFYNSGVQSIVLDNGCSSILSASYFKGCNNLVSVTSTFENEITAINDDAFYGLAGLQTVSLHMADGGVIGANVFYNCSTLTTVEIEGAIESIGEDAFRGCSALQTISFDEGLTTIGKGAFIDCSTLSEITFPGTVAEIGNTAFNGCNELTTITFEPDTAHNAPLRIGYDVTNNCSMFKQNTNLKTVNLARNFDSTSNYRPFAGNTNITTLNINTGCDTIDSNAFVGCTALQSATLNEGLKVISDNAFVNCSTLADITISGSVDSIGNGVFSGCNALATVTFLPNEEGIPLRVGSAADGSLFKSNSNLRRVNIARDFIQHQQPLFAGNQYITTAYINEGCDTIAANLFYQSTALASVFISESVKVIEERAFNGCTALKDVNMYNGIDGGVETIGAYAFAGCTSMPVIALPQSLDSITVNTFSDCTALQHLYALPTTPPNVSGDSNTDGYFDPSKCSLYVKEESVASYKEHSYWREFKEHLEINSVGAQFESNGIMYQIVSYDANDKNGNVKVVSNPIHTLAGFIEIPDTVLNPYDNISYRVDSIATGAFATGCTAIEDIFLPNSVVENAGGLPSGVFDEIESLASIIIAANEPVEMVATDIFNETIYNKVTLYAPTPSNCTQYPWNDFTTKTQTGVDEMQFVVDNLLYEIISHNDQTLKVVKVYNTELVADTVTIPDMVRCIYNAQDYTVTEVADKAFANCSSVKHIVVGGNVVKMGNTVFKNCNQLSHITFLQNNAGTALKIGYNKDNNGSMFKLNGALRIVNLARNFDCVGGTLEDGDFKYTPFGDCAQITTLNINAGCTELSKYAFRDCEALSTVNFATNTTLQTIGKDAFRNCKALAEITIPGSVTKIGNNAFYDCGALHTITFAANDNNTALEIGYTTVGVNNSLFMDNANLRTVNIARSFTYNESDMIYAPFSECDQLQTVNFMAGTYGVGKYQFRDCTGLTTITIDENSTFTGMGEDAFRNCNKVAHALSFKMSQGSTVGKGAFRDCMKLTGLYFSEGVVRFGNDAIRNCIAITEFVFPGTLTYVGINAFYDCESIETLRFNPNETGEILWLDYADRPNYSGECTTFNLCEKLHTIYLGRSIDQCWHTEASKILWYPGALGKIENLKEVHIMKGCDTLGINLFHLDYALEKVYVDEDNTLQKIFNYAFRWCEELEYIELEKCDKLVYCSDAFVGCDLLKKITFPGSIKQLSSRVFIGCDALKEVTFLPGNDENNPTLEIFDNNSLFEDTDLKTLNLARNISYITPPLEDINSLVTVNINKGCTAINKKMFRDQENLTTLKVDTACRFTLIDEDAFRNCNKIAHSLHFNMADSSTIGKSAFRDCVKVPSLTFSEGVATVGGEAFRNCEKLTTMTFPSSVDSIGSQVFYDCSALNEVCSFATTPPTIVETTFNHFSGKAPIYVPYVAVDSYKNTWSSRADYIEAYDKIVCDKNYILDCIDNDPWTINTDDEVLAIFTNAMTGDTVFVEGTVMKKNVNNIPYTSVLFYLAQGNADATLGEGNHRFTHVEFIKMNGDAVDHTTGSVYYNDEDKNVYDLYNRKWITADLSTRLDDVEADGERTMRIYAAGGNVVVHGAAEGETIAIYDLAGTLCHTSCVDSDVQRIALPTRGIYIVRVGACVAKVVI